MNFMKMGILNFHFQCKYFKLYIFTIRSQHTNADLIQRQELNARVLCRKWPRFYAFPLCTVDRTPIICCLSPEICLWSSCIKKGVKLMLVWLLLFLFTITITKLKSLTITIELIKNSKWLIVSSKAWLKAVLKHHVLYDINDPNYKDVEKKNEK